MGVWGIGIFENDTAMDFCYDELETRHDLAPLEQVLSEVIYYDGEPDDYSCQEALVAAAVIVAIRQKNDTLLPECLKHYYTKASSQGFLGLRFYKSLPIGLIEDAKRAVELINRHSELKDLWDEAGLEEYQAWKAINDGLIRDLSRGPMLAKILKLSPVCVVWDDTCAFCARSIRIIQRLDVWGLVHTVPASKAALAPAHWVMGWKADDTQRGLWCRPIEEVTQMPLKHTACVGFKAVRRLGWVLPLTWPVFWLGYVPLLSWIGDMLYAWIAKNRHRWGCESSSCNA